MLRSSKSGSVRTNLVGNPVPAERASYATVKKNDTWDSQCIYSVLIRRYTIFLEAKPQDYYWTMRYLVNRRDALVKATTKLIQQFHDQTENVYPSLKQKKWMKRQR